MKPSTKKKLYRRLIKISAIGSLFGIFIAISFYQAVNYGAFGKMPTNSELLKIKNYEASEVFSADSVLIGKFYIENRSNITLADVAPHVVNQLIATEDVRFYEHDGFDKTSALRVLFKSIILGQNKGGGSTISQQLAKNLFGRNSYGILTMPINKTKEVIIAQQLEALYTKDQILELYLNTVSFGEDTYGIKSASQRFFNTSPTNISIENAAVLIGMLKNPTIFNPRLHPEKAIKRRNTVLTQTAKYGFIDDSLSTTLQSKKIQLDYTVLSYSSGIAPHFRQKIKQKLKNALENKDNVNNQLLTSGLKIYTTINYKLQQIAESAVLKNLQRLQPQLYRNIKGNYKIKKHLTRIVKASASYQTLLQKGKKPNEILKLLGISQTRKMPVNFELKDTLISFIDSVTLANALLHSGMYVVQPQNGHVLAWVGDANYQITQYDHVESKRQVGSIFKPFIYAAALENGYKPCTYIDNSKTAYEAYDNWTPSNSDGNYDGRYSLVGGITNSVNTISVKLLVDLGILKTIKFVKSLGLKDSLPPVPSIALGVSNHSLFDMVNAYTSFANNGKKNTPVFITNVINNQGKSIYSEQTKTKQTISKQTALQITEMLESVVNNGTAKRLKNKYNIKGKIHGKTGTTQNHSDGWFMGYKKNFIAGVWVGASSPEIHFNNITQGQGANMALPAWAYFYSEACKEQNLRSFISANIKYPPSINCGMYKEDNILQKIFSKKEKSFKRKGLNENKFTKGIRKIFKRKKKD